VKKPLYSLWFTSFNVSDMLNSLLLLAAAKLESWDNPKTKKDDDEVIVYGVNSGQHEIIYNTSMYSLALFGSR
jgi:hypothetical protein